MATAGIPLRNVWYSSMNSKNCSIKLSLENWKKKIVCVYSDGSDKEFFNCFLDEVQLIDSSSSMLELRDQETENPVKKIVEFKLPSDKKLFQQQCEAICQRVKNARVGGIAYDDCSIEISVTGTEKKVALSSLADDGTKTLLFECRAEDKSILDDNEAGTILKFKDNEDYNEVKFFSIGHKELLKQQCFPEDFLVCQSGLVDVFVRDSLFAKYGCAFSKVQYGGIRNFECRKLVQISDEVIQQKLYGLKEKYYSQYAFPPVNVKVAIAKQLAADPKIVTIQESKDDPTIIATMEFGSPEMAELFLFEWDEAGCMSNGQVH